MRKAYSLLSLPLLLSVSIAGLMPVRTQAADIGPKPEMEFTFQFPPGSELRIVQGELLQCEKLDCGDAEPLPELGPQAFTCNETSCRSMAYGYAPYSRLRVEFSDGEVRESNSFTHDRLSAAYHVTVRDRDLVVEGSSSRFRPNALLLMALIIGGIFYFMVAVGLLAIHVLRAGQGRGGAQASPRLYILSWIVMAPALALSLFGFVGYLPTAIPLTLMVEALVALIYSRMARISWRPFLTMALMANIFTVAPFWFVFAALYPGFSIPALLGAEVLVWLVEAGVIFGALRGQISLRTALIYSLIANLLSLAVGLLFPI
jgi:hypothetical protein